MDISGWTPPPPLPRRELTYEPHSSLPPARPFSQMRGSTGPRPSACPTMGTVEAAGAMNCTDYAMTATPGTNGQQNQQIPSPSRAHNAFPNTVYFKDHMQRLAMMVFAPDPNLTLSGFYLSGMQTGVCLIPSTTRQPTTPTSPEHPAQSQDAKPERPQVTIQIYFHSSGPAFNTNHGLINVEKWCRQLQISTAFQHLRNQLREHCGASEFSPSIRIEAYDALPDYTVIIHHSLNEREYRGLQEYYEYTEMFLQHTKKLCSRPAYVMPEHVHTKGLAYLASRKIIKEQMDDIRSGDGGRNRRRRAALREHLAPAFDDGRGPDRNEGVNTFGSTWSLNRHQLPAEQSMPPPPYANLSQTSANVSPGAAKPNQSGSPKPVGHSPGQGQRQMSIQQPQPPSSSSLDPRVRQRTSTQQNPRPSTAVEQPIHQANTRPSPRNPQPLPTPMPPPPTPAQGHQRPLPREGSLANPHPFAPLPLLLKSIYRGVTQPYHNIVLVIDSPHWASVSGLGVLQFGYEPDWANGENIQRSGATFERVGMSRGTGRRWLGDALVECFVGDGRTQEGVLEWLKEVGGGGVGLPGGEGSTDEDFGMGMGQVSEETARLLRGHSVPGADNVDFLEGEWCGLL